ncbi:hypothetical protein DFH28DRAFT_884293 [Melampsora americana]|nr:hypothetical protein DFH28DRAFT_884293 [Melampsora americana]
MQWATQHHISMMVLFQDLRKPEPTSKAAQSFLSSPFLYSPDPNAITVAATVIVWNRLVEVLHLQELWNPVIKKFYFKTALQDGDAGLLEQWESQLAFIAQLRATGGLSPVLGNFSKISVDVFESDSDPNTSDTNITSAEELDSSDAGLSEDEEALGLESLNI